MKTNNKKGFTIVELVIVIAVIAILAAVLIPTFSGIINKANDSAALQEARGILTNYYAEVAEDGETIDDVYVKVEKNGSVKYFKVENGELSKTAEDEAPSVSSVIISDADNDGKVAVETIG